MEMVLEGMQLGKHCPFLSVLEGETGSRYCVCPMRPCLVPLLPHSKALLEIGGKEA